MTPLPSFGWFRPLKSGIFGLIASLTLALPSYAAEKISFVFDSLILSIPVSDLETYAKDGELSQQLTRYFSLAGATEEDKAAFRQALLTPAPVKPLRFSRILNTEEGERLLKYFGKVINVQGGSNGKFLIRGALVEAALDKEGLTLINFLKKLSTNVQIDLKQALNLGQQVEIVVNATYLFTEEVDRLAQIEAEKTEKVNFSQLSDPRQPGPFEVKKQTWNLTDEKRNRQFYVDVYQPQILQSEKVPVVVISHGLSSRPEDFSKWGQHLASYGYVVALPQHPGSDIKQTEDFLEGFSRQIFLRNEFIDRPLDLSYTIDELERRNQSSFAGRLNLKEVGVLGHSFGGYTVLSVAGATIDFDRLEEVCNLEIGDLNTALLLQCRALKLERKDYNFKDPRVKAVFVVNPVNSGLFGSKSLRKIDIPVFISAGSYDPATPFIFEQVVSYPRLKVTDKYLQLQEGQAHVDFSQLDAGLTDMLETTTDLTLPSPQLLDSYTNSMILSFFEVYINNNPEYTPYLSSAYANYLSEGQEFKTYLITEKSSESLTTSIEKFIRENSIKVPQNR
ncbi:alpha/beta hydrolase [Crocosphaera sp. UHCC 0190]|uniref:alpha/beta hydrolase n=1 Tax=Crocosphaera sp. UHCC 0190 TaxID=3110246 RepID=UPI002B20D940|nr:alpha/beta hydrolase [Crocosphaera sp. UHCC 0190]MEA5512219.1 alpha/beta hydrolase [Crocosphaera sp. UHCC 0190]